MSDRGGVVTLPLGIRGRVIVFPDWLAPAINGGVVATHVYLAVGFLGSPRLRSSGSYTYILAWAPAHVWAWAFGVAAVLSYLAPYLRRWGNAAYRLLAVLPLLALLAGYGAAQLARLSEGWGSLLLLWPIGAHVVLVAARHHPGTRRA